MDIYTNLINNSNTNTVNYYVNSSDRTLKAIEKDYQGVINNDDRIDIDIDDDSILCLKIRQKIEILLRQIAQKNNIIKNNTTIPLLRVLVNEGLISRKLYDILIEIIIICNNAIHGKKISENHRDFIINTYTQVLLELEEYTKK